VLQQLVADPVAERVVDVLEPVEIDEEQRAAAGRALLALQRFVRTAPASRYGADIAAAERRLQLEQKAEQE